MSVYVAMVEPDLGPRLYRWDMDQIRLLWPMGEARRRRQKGRHWGPGAAGASYVAWIILYASTGDENVASRFADLFASAIVRTAPQGGFMVDDDFISDWRAGVSKAFKPTPHVDPTAEVHLN